MDIKKIAAEINDLPPEERQAKLDALRAIINARLSGSQEGAEATSNDADKLKQPRSKKKDDKSQQGQNQQSNQNQEQGQSREDGQQGQGDRDGNSQDQSNQGDQSESSSSQSQQNQNQKSNSPQQNKDQPQPSRKNDKVDPTIDSHEIAGNKINKKVIEARRTQREAEKAAEEAEKRGEADTAKQLKDIAKSLADKSNDEIDQMSDQEIDDLADKVADLAKNLTSVRKTDKNAKQDRIKKIHDLDNDDVANQDLQDQETQLAADAKALKAQKDEIAKYNAKPQMGSLNALRNELFRTIKDQIKLVMQNKYSYMALSKRQLAGFDVIEPGILQDFVKSKDVPTIDVYFDQSGSWGDADIEAGDSALSVLNDFVRKKLCKVNVYYFAEHISKTNNHFVIGGGTSAWYEILDNIKASKAKNVLIMTDGDMNSMAGREHVHVKGTVWWLWKTADDTGRTLMQDLRGSSNKQFVIQNND